MHETILPEIKERPSKSAQKRMAKEIEKFAENLLKLSPKQLTLLDLPEDALDLILLGKKSKASSGRSRLVKGVAGILRDDEVWGTEEAVKQFDQISKGRTKLVLEI